MVATAAPLLNILTGLLTTTASGLLLKFALLVREAVAGMDPDRNCKLWCIVGVFSRQQIECISGQTTVLRKRTCTESHRSNMVNDIADAFERWSRYGAAVTEMNDEVMNSTVIGSKVDAAA